MLIALVDGIESLLRNNDCNDERLQYFVGPRIVTPSHADICYMGYVFRITVRADPELQLLRRLRKPGCDAEALRQTLERTTVLAARHHMLVHAVYTRHPSASATVRLVQRWVATHLLSDHLPLEALEWMVVHVYSDPSSPLDPPGTAVAGFLRFLQLLGKHDWQREPMIVDPSSLLNARDRSIIRAQFDQTRGTSYQNGPAMYIVSPCSHAHFEDDQNNAAESAAASAVTNALPVNDSNSWSPIHTASHPERVVLSRAVALADRTYSFLQNAMMNFENATWATIFQESAESFQSYSALLRVDPASAVNTEASSTLGANRSLEVLDDTNGDTDIVINSTYTRSMQTLVEGPKELRRKVYRNLRADDNGTNDGSTLLEWCPVQAMVAALRCKLGHCALFFYNHLCPDVIAVVWRPYGPSRAFSVLASEYVQPVQSDDWQSDTLVTLNVYDLLREVSRLTKDVVTNVKVLDAGSCIQLSAISGKKKRSIEKDDDEDRMRNSDTSTPDNDSE